MSAVEIAIRGYTRQDARAVRVIEEATFVNPWTAKEFEATLKAAHTFCAVGVAGEVIVAFLIVVSTPESFQVISMAVHPDFRRKGVGRRMLGWLCDRAMTSKRTSVGLEARETNLDVQLFLKACGFRAVEVLPRYFDDSHEDGYRFVRITRELEPASVPGAPTE